MNTEWKYPLNRDALSESETATMLSRWRVGGIGAKVRDIPQWSEVDSGGIVEHCCNCSVFASIARSISDEVPEWLYNMSGTGDNLGKRKTEQNITNMRK